MSDSRPASVSLVQCVYLCCLILTLISALCILSRHKRDVEALEARISHLESSLIRYQSTHP